MALALSMALFAMAVLPTNPHHLISHTVFIEWF
jgi:hypothetical protein